MENLTPEQREVALAEGQRWWDSSHDRLRYAVEYAQAGTKSLFLANGGGIIALLTFAGNSGAIIEVRALFWSFAWFGLGCFSALVIYISGYVTQSTAMQAEFINSRKAISDYLNLQPSFDISYYRSKSAVAENIGMVSAFVSLGMFLTGALVGLDAVT
ncbi:MAG: hypothetical protein WA842_02210 [Croceibacterium sp.]